MSQPADPVVVTWWSSIGRGNSITGSAVLRDIVHGDGVDLAVVSGRTAFGMVLCDESAEVQSLPCSRDMSAWADRTGFSRSLFALVRLMALDYGRAEWGVPPRVRPVVRTLAV